MNLTPLDQLLPEKGAPPPRPKLILRIGITGHRLDKLDERKIESLKKEIKRVFEELKDMVYKIYKKNQGLYEKAPIFRLISPLAEGADEIAADAAHELNFQLEFPIPFFETDLIAEARRKYTQNSRIPKVLEIDGSVDKEKETYESAGLMVLRHSDVLIAIWDGEEPRGVGGTGQIVEEAYKFRTPIIRINPSNPTDVKIVVKTGKGEWNFIDSPIAWIRPLLRKLTPPIQRNTHHHLKEVDFKKKYFKEIAPGFTFRKKPHLNWSVELAHVPEMNDHEEVSLMDPINYIERKIRKHFEYADGLAKRYANLYRFGFVWNYLMTGVAVLIAFLGYKSQNLFFGVIETIAIGSIILVYLANKIWKWNDRRIDYRLLAELLRQTRFLGTISRIPPLSTPDPIHMHYGDPSSSWVQWHFQAIIRDLGIVPAKLTPQYVKATAKLIQYETKQQADYHEKTHSKSEKTDKLLHRWALCMFLFAAVGCAAHLSHLPKTIKGAMPEDALNRFGGLVDMVVPLLTIVAPAFGAAFAGIRSQGEYERVARHSSAMEAYLKEKCKDLDKFLKDEERLNSAELAKIGDEISLKMIEEILDWRIVFHKRPIELA